MKHFYLTFIFLFGLLNINLAQKLNCDYYLLLQQGKALFKNEQYMAALKKFNAARICDRSKALEIDKEVDKIFKAIEQQRDEAQKAQLETERARKKLEISEQQAREAQALAEAMRDSVLKANDRETKAIERELFEKQQRIKSEIAAADHFFNVADSLNVKGEYLEASRSYQQGLNLIEPNINYEPKLLITQRTFHQKLEQLNQKISDQKRVNQLLTQADSILKLKKGHLSYYKTYDTYFEALRLGADSSIIKSKLNELEMLAKPYLNFGRKFYQIEDTLTYYRLLSRSAEANLFLGNSNLAKRKVRSLFSYEPSNLRFIHNDELLKYSNAFRKGPLKFYVGGGVKDYLHYISYSANNFTMLTFSTKVEIWKNAGFGVEYAYGENEDKNKQNEVSIFYFRYLLKNNIIKKININGLLGITGGKGPSFYSNSSYFAYHEVSSSIHEKLAKKESEGFFSEDFGVRAFSLNVPDIFLQTIPIYSLIDKPDYRGVDFRVHNQKYSSSSSSSSYINTYIGIQVNYKPFKFSPWYLFGEIAYNHQIFSGFKRGKYNLVEPIVDFFVKNFDFNQNELSELRNGLTMTDFDNVTFSSKGKADFTSGFSIKFGFNFLF